MKTLRFLILLSLLPWFLLATWDRGDTDSLAWMIVWAIGVLSYPLEWIVGRRRAEPRGLRRAA